MSLEIRPVGRSGRPELDHWFTSNVVTPLFDAFRDYQTAIDVELDVDRKWTKKIEQVKTAITEKVLEAYDLGHHESGGGKRYERAGVLRFVFWA